MARLPGGIRVLGGGFLKGGDRQRAEFPPGWPERLRDLYRRGNRNLVERYELPLREHDYAVLRAIKASCRVRVACMAGAPPFQVADSAVPPHPSPPSPLRTGPLCPARAARPPLSTAQRT